MKAQVRWKKLYNLYHFFNTEILHDPIRKILKEYRREAALERKLEAAQRRIDDLEYALHLAQQQTAECEERREFAACLEFGG